MQKRVPRDRVWKDLEVHQGQGKLFDDSKCFFYITNDRKSSAAEIVTANNRCNQENLIEQHKNGVRALTAPLDNLESNWASMVIASLAWSLKAWAALLLPEHGRGARSTAREANAVADGLRYVPQRDDQYPGPDC